MCWICDHLEATHEDYLNQSRATIDDFGWAVQGVEQVRLAGGPLVEIVKVAEPTAHLLTAASLYGPKLRALQVVHADDAGQWPWDRRYRGVRRGQPVLGPRARRSAGRRRSA
jgi:hypothetical protein